MCSAAAAAAACLTLSYLASSGFSPVACSQAAIVSSVSLLCRGLAPRFFLRAWPQRHRPAAPLFSLRLSAGRPPPIVRWRARATVKWWRVPVIRCCLGMCRGLLSVGVRRARRLPPFRVCWPTSGASSLGQLVSESVAGLACLGCPALPCRSLAWDWCCRCLLLPLALCAPPGSPRLLLVLVGVAVCLRLELGCLWACWCCRFCCGVAPSAPPLGLV